MENGVLEVVNVGVLEFVLADDVQNRHLESGSRRALVSLFGEDCQWVHQPWGGR
jgi:hypothetical protein